jgi:hypothetical protein
MTDRDKSILRHIGLQRVSLRVVIEHLFFDGASSDDVLRRLLSEKRIQTSKIGDGYSLYRLTISEARAQGIPAHHSGPKFSSSVARKHLSILWFCCMETTRRFVVSRSALGKLFGRGKGLGLPHCWEPVSPDRKLVRRLYTPGPNSGNEDVLRTLAIDAAEAVTHEKMAPYVLSRLYIFTVLVETTERAEALRKKLERDSDLPVAVDVAVVPGPLNLKAAVQLHKSKSGEK